MACLALVLDRCPASPGVEGADGTTELALFEPVLATAAQALLEAGHEAWVVRSRPGEHPLDLARRIDKLEPVAVLVLRFSGAPAEQPVSTWTLGLHLPGSRQAAALATSVAAAVSQTIGTEAHGPSPRRVGPGGAPLDLLRGTTAPCAMVVTHGGMVPALQARAVASAADGSLGRAIADAIETWLG